MATAWDAGSIVLAPASYCRVTEIQKENVIASFVPSSAISTHATQRYAYMQTAMGMQNDAEQVLGFLVAVMVATGNTTKSQAADSMLLINEYATQALEEFFGLQKMPVHRPDSDQMAELIRTVTAARSAASLPALPVLH